jgi:hypothetical protein
LLDSFFTFSTLSSFTLSTLYSFILNFSTDSFFTVSSFLTAISESLIGIFYNSGISLYSSLTILSYSLSLL